jgi:tetratricopeptide (TPR) repeat protein
MSKLQYGLITLAIILVGTFMLLPKVVVKNENSENTLTEKKEEDHSGHDHAEGEGHNEEETSITAQHQVQLPAAKKADLVRWQKSFMEAQSEEEQKNVLDSLQTLWLGINRLDSAAHYWNMFYEKYPNQGNLLATANAYYEAYSFAMDEGKMNSLRKKAQSLFQKALEINPDLLEAKVKLGVTYVAEAPMKGIGIIREVLDKDPNNITAIYNLGLLSMQSGQFDKAIARFEKLTELEKDNLNHYLYLGISQMQAGKKDAARNTFEHVKANSSDAQLVKVATDYLAQL